MAADPGPPIWFMIILIGGGITFVALMGIYFLQGTRAARLPKRRLLAAQPSDVLSAALETARALSLEILSQDERGFVFRSSFGPFPGPLIKATASLNSAGNTELSLAKVATGTYGFRATDLAEVRFLDEFDRRCDASKYPARLR
jgi:hypothetical protein